MWCDFVEEVCGQSTNQLSIVVIFICQLNLELKLWWSQGVLRAKESRLCCIWGSDQWGHIGEAVNICHWNVIKTFFTIFSINSFLFAVKITVAQTAEFLFANLKETGKSNSKCAFFEQGLISSWCDFSVWGKIELDSSLWKTTKIPSWCQDCTGLCEPI